MSVHRSTRTTNGTQRTSYVVRYRQGTRNRQRTFDRASDARAFDDEVRRRRQAGPSAVRALDAGRETLDEYVVQTWTPAHAAHLAPKTRRTYAQMYDCHIAPALGGTRLCDIDPEAIAAWRGSLIGRIGPEALHKAMTLLGAILQRAAEAQRIPYNPARLVSKPRRTKAPEVRPLAPAQVEAIRASVDPRSAAVVSVLAYAGLRPHELRRLRWRDVRDATLLVYATKTQTRRTVRLLAPLAADLAAWRLASGRPAADALVFADEDGGEWSSNGFNKWRARVFGPALRAAGLERGRPYDLRHSFASLLLHEGRSPIYVARQLGHGAALTMGTYGHVIDELEDAPNLPAEDAIRAAREGRNGGSCSPLVRVPQAAAGA
ncbi:MAG: site-specific integrase [Solirubrobacteraceae bacterium MAG38_C4-C5]|nr:site-specific integrase [Candidatus Siliceabacter maunaloa]